MFKIKVVAENLNSIMFKFAFQAAFHTVAVSMAAVLQAGRTARLVTFITVQSVANVLTSVGWVLFTGYLGLAVCLWHDTMAVLAGVVCKQARGQRTAHSTAADSHKRTFGRELQYSICSSILLLFTIFQLLASLHVAWAVLAHARGGPPAGTGYTHAWNVAAGFAV